MLERIKNLVHSLDLSGMQIARERALQQELYTLSVEIRELLTLEADVTPYG